MDTILLRMMGFPIRKSPGQGLFGSYPRLIAAFHVLHRLLAPRHPPYALSSLTTLLIVDDQPCVHKAQGWFTHLRHFCGAFATFSAIQFSKSVFPRGGRILHISIWKPFMSLAFSFHKWWSRAGSNRQPPACKAGALPVELHPLCYSV